MSKYTQKPYSADEKRKAVEQFAEKISYSPRYSSEYTPIPKRRTT
jgi:cyclin-dependent kinase regulatory subunit CKS1